MQNVCLLVKKRENTNFCNDLYERTQLSKQKTLFALMSCQLSNYSASQFAELRRLLRGMSSDVSFFVAIFSIHLLITEGQEGDGRIGLQQASLLASFSYFCSTFSSRQQISKQSSGGSKPSEVSSIFMFLFILSFRTNQMRNRTLQSIPILLRQR
jgi:hypothetical protein